MLDFLGLFPLHVEITYFKPQLLFFTKTSKALMFFTEKQAVPGKSVFVRVQFTPMPQVTDVFKITVTEVI